jgi:dTDP-4-amino-4,6-dideoxygalactose transaminase
MVCLYTNIYTIAGKGEKMKTNIETQISKVINKKFAIAVFSGTIAIESALICLKIKKGDKVLISSSVCYSVFESIVRVGAIPVIVSPSQDFTLSPKDVQIVLNEEKDIKCIILVYQYGLTQNTKRISEVTKNIPIIEDIAQAWNISIKEAKIGEYSDIVITSFGKTKPISIGYGGAMFSNNNYNDLFDFYDNKSREKSGVLLPYTIDTSSINSSIILKNANKIVDYQRMIAAQLSECFLNKEGIHYIIDEDGSMSTWHRFPICIDDVKLFNELIILLNKFDIKFQLPHDKELFEIEMVKNSNAIIYKKHYKKRNWILIRTRTNEMKKIKLLKEALEEYYEKKDTICNS